MHRKACNRRQPETSRSLIRLQRWTGRLVARDDVVRMKHPAELWMFLALLLLGTPASVVAQQKAEPQKRERLRIGIAPVRNLTTALISVHVLASEIRQELVSKATEAELLLGTSRDEIEGDAAKKSCDYILYADVEQMRHVARGPRTAGADRADDPNLHEPRGTFVGQLRVRLVEVGSLRTRFDQKIHSVGGGMTAQDAALALTHSIRRLVLRALGVK